MDGSLWALAVLWTGFALVFAWRSWSSLRRLRTAPQFAHRAEMMWGATWWGVVSFLLLLVPPLASILLRRIDAPEWASGFQSLLFGIGLWVLLVRVLPWQAEGWWAGPRAVMGLQPDGTIDWDEYLQRCEREQRSWLVRYALPLAGLALIARGVQELLASAVG